MEETSYRDYKTILLYLEEDWNTHTKLDHYLAQIALEVKRVLMTNPNQIQLDSMFIPFESSIKEEVPELTEEEEQQRLADLTKIAKAASAARFGFTPEQKKQLNKRGRKQ